MTDSGGIQEEAPGLGKPVLVMRDTTERPEALASGTVHLVGTDYDKIVTEVSTLLDDQEAYNKMKEELAHREGELREEIAHKIAVARAEGDLSENGGYQAAREAQSKNEGRITELTVKLRDSKIIENQKRIAIQAFDITVSVFIEHGAEAIQYF